MESEIKRLHVNRGGDLLTYEKQEGSEGVMLVELDEGLYEVRLKPEQYSFMAREVGPGDAIVELVGGGGFTARVLSTEPDQLSESDSCPVHLKLQVLERSQQ